ncbi:MAG: peptidoglycan-associated lipoprotein Pal [Desulfobacteraceae bacterium]|nr:peptidoglycan-associated lipoprotein Pal [Desulfobacteraceae bacterium]
MKKVLRLVTVASLTTSMALFAAGCAKKQVQTGEGMETKPAVQAPAPATAPGEESLSSAPQPASNAAISEGRTSAPMLPVYFDFDQSNIKADQESRMEKDASFLKDNPETRIQIQGNCDERGTNEYNMALGERRATSAKKYLMNLGIAENRLSTISFGEEKPLAMGHDESAWSQNRRDDFVIQ